MSLLFFDYKVENNDDTALQQLINDYIWDEANKYISSDVNEMKNRIKQQIGRIDDKTIMHTYTYKTLYDKNYSCDINCIQMSFESFANKLIPDLRNQFAYEEAIYELIYERALFPIVAYSNQLFIDSDIEIRMHIQRSSLHNSRCSGYLRLGFPYHYFRVSPIKK